MSSATGQTMKFCKDCSHYRHNINTSFARCASPKNGVDMVTGEINIKYCSVNREFHCGLDAEWFEPKSEPKSELVEKKPFWKFW